MDVNTVINLVSGGAGAITVLVAVLIMIIAENGRLMTRVSHDEVVTGLRTTIADKDKQIEALTRAVDKERERADAGVLAAQNTRDLLQGLRKAIE